MTQRSDLDHWLVLMMEALILHRNAFGFVEPVSEWAGFSHEGMFYTLSDARVVVSAGQFGKVLCSSDGGSVDDAIAEDVIGNIPGAIKALTKDIDRLGSQGAGARYPRKFGDC